MAESDLGLPRLELFLATRCGEQRRGYRQNYYYPLICL